MGQNMEEHLPTSTTRVYGGKVTLTLSVCSHQKGGRSLHNPPYSAPHSELLGRSLLRVEYWYLYFHTVKSKYSPVSTLSLRTSATLQDSV